MLGRPKTRYNKHPLSRPTGTNDVLNSNEDSFSMYARDERFFSNYFGGSKPPVFFAKPLKNGNSVGDSYYQEDK